MVETNKVTALHGKLVRHAIKHSLNRLPSSNELEVEKNALGMGSPKMTDEGANGSNIIQMYSEYVC